MAHQNLSGNVNVPAVAQTTQNIWKFMVGKSSLQEIAILVIIWEISDSNLETGRYGPESGISRIIRESWQHWICNSKDLESGLLRHLWWKVGLWRWCIRARETFLSFITRITRILFRKVSLSKSVRFIFTCKKSLIYSQSLEAQRMAYSCFHMWKYNQSAPHTTTPVALWNYRI